MTKVTLIGAGSTIFAKNLIGDLLSYPELADVTLCLFDIDAKRLDLSERVAHRIVDKLGAHPEVIATTDVVQRSLEYGAAIIHSLETGEPRVVYGNVLNGGLIENLPEACCVEVPCLVDRNGVQLMKVGRLPIQLAALTQTNISVQMLVAEAVLAGRREHVYQAALLDPHTAAELAPDEIYRLLDDLFEAHGTTLELN